MPTQQFNEKSRLGKILVKRQYISERELTRALVYQSKYEMRIGEALIALDLITPLQLKRALRRQNWARSMAAGVALMVTPFTPAMAAGNGNLGSISTATSHITLNVLPKSQAQSNGELKFSSSDLHATESGFCTSDSGINLYRVKLAGSGNGGDFQVSNGFQNPLTISASYKHQQGRFLSLLPNQFSPIHSNSSSSKNCESAFSNQLKVSFSEQQLSTNTSQSYNGVLTLTIAAE